MFSKCLKFDILAKFQQFIDIASGYSEKSEAFLVIPLPNKQLTVLFLSLDEFKEFCLRKPEYALLFIHFRKLQSATSSMTFSRTELRSTGSFIDDQEPYLVTDDSLPEVSV